MDLGLDDAAGLPAAAADAPTGNTDGAPVAATDAGERLGGLARTAVAARGHGLDLAGPDGPRRGVVA